jgi:hypothetical protein
MQFRLVYRGPLPSASNSNSRAHEKHLIRKCLDPQLRELWRTHPFLKVYQDMVVEHEGTTLPYPESIANRFSMFGYRFVPLIGEAFGNGPKSLACALDILFLRFDQPPGDILRGGGGIDNRIKTLFDALQMPRSGEGVDSPDGTDNLMYCLLEDDSLVTEVKITTDRLLEQRISAHPSLDVHLIIHVKTLVLGRAASRRS